MKRIVSISDNAFLAMLFAAMEVYPPKYRGSRAANGCKFKYGETYGLLFGIVSDASERKTFQVDLAVPIQTAAKDENSVYVESQPLDHAITVIKYHPIYQLIGTFHSHPYPFLREDRPRPNALTSKEFRMWGTDPSSTDTRSAAIECNEAQHDIITIIVGLMHFDQRRSTILSRQANKIINHWGNYRYVLAATFMEYDKVKNAKSNDTENWQNDTPLTPVNQLLCPFASAISNPELNHNR